MTHSFPTRRSSDISLAAKGQLLRRRKNGRAMVQELLIRCRRLRRGRDGDDPRGHPHGRHGHHGGHRSEEHTSELQSLMRISYSVFCLKKKTFSYIFSHSFSFFFFLFFFSFY